jgi:hypothetical protein
MRKLYKSDGLINKAEMTRRTEIVAMLRGQYAMACRWSKAGKLVDVARAKFLFDEAKRLLLSDM